MKFAEAVVSVIIIAAVLLSAYAVGLLIREARTGSLQPGPQSVAEANDTAIRPQAAALAAGPGGQKAAAPEQAVELKEQTQVVADPNLPKEKKLPKGGTDGRRGGKGPRALSPQDRERMRQRLESMSDEQRQSLKARTKPRSGSGRQQRRGDVPEEGTDAGQDMGENGPAPDEGDLR